MAQEQEAEISTGYLIEADQPNFFVRLWNVITGKSSGGDGSLFTVFVFGTNKQLYGQGYHRGETVKYESVVQYPQDGGCPWFAPGGPYHYVDLYDKNDKLLHRGRRKLTDSEIRKGATVASSYSYTIPTTANIGDPYYIVEQIFCETALGAGSRLYANTGGKFVVSECTPFVGGTTTQAFCTGDGKVAKISTSITCAQSTTILDPCDPSYQVCKGSTVASPSGAECVDRCEGVTCAAKSYTCTDGYKVTLNGACDGGNGQCVYTDGPTQCKNEGHGSVSDKCILSYNTANEPVYKQCAQTNLGKCPGNGQSAIVDTQCISSSGACESIYSSLSQACSALYGQDGLVCQPNPLTGTKTCPTLNGGQTIKSCTNTCKYGVTTDCAASLKCDNPCNGWSPEYATLTCPNGDVVQAASKCDTNTGIVNPGNPSCTAAQNEVCGNKYCNVAYETEANCPADCVDPCKSHTNNGKCEPSCGETSADADCKVPDPCASEVCGNGVCKTGCETTLNCAKDCPINACEGTWCGDKICQDGQGGRPSCSESSSTCINDCGVQNCGNGKCETDLGESWTTCQKDCVNPCDSNPCGLGCPPNPAQCDPCSTEYCGNGECNAACGEVQGKTNTAPSCKSDCGVPPPNCIPGVDPECTPSYCGDLTCDPGETKAAVPSRATDCAIDCGVLSCEEDSTQTKCREPTCEEKPDQERCKNPFFEWLKENPLIATAGVAVVVIGGIVGLNSFTKGKKPKGKRVRR